MGQRVTLNRAISKLGYGSRGQAMSWIQDGKVRVDGTTTRNPLAWVDLSFQKIVVDLPVQSKSKTITLLLNKPKGVVCTHSDELGRKTIYDLIGPEHGHLLSAGRLDADSEGLLIISNDSGLTDHLTRPDHEVAKTYEVVVKPVLSQSSLDKLRQGVEVDGRPTRKCEVEILSFGNEDMILKIVLREGRNRQIRKMVRTQGSKVKRLVRTAIGLVKLEGITPGSFRPATPQELNSLRKQGPSAGDPRRVLKPGPVAKGRKKLLPGKNAGTPGAGNRFPDRQAPGPGQPSKDSHPRRRPR